MAEKFGSSHVDSPPERRRSRAAPVEKFSRPARGEEEEREPPEAAKPSARPQAFKWRNGSLFSNPPYGSVEFFTEDIDVHDRTVSVQFVRLESKFDSFVRTAGEYERVLIELTLPG